MAYLQAHMLLLEDMGGAETASSSSSVRSKLKSGDMEANVWALLPNSILTDGILKRLPLIFNLRFRSVCKAWSKLLSSYSPPPTRGICLFGTSTKTIKLDFSFLPKDEVLQPCAAGGGLICFMRNRGKRRQESVICHEDFFICNPVTKKYKQLTGKLNEVLLRNEADDDLVQVIYELIVDGSNEYKFFVGRVGTSLITVHIYDSRTSCWTKEVTPEPSHPHNFIHWDLEIVPVFQTGQLKVVDVLHFDCDVEKCDMQSKRIHTALPVSHGSGFRVIAAQDSLFATEVVMSPSKELKIWRQDGNGWDKVSALPRNLAESLLECFTEGQIPKDQHLHCQMCWFSEDILCIKLSKAQTHRLLTFHLQTRRWQVWHSQFRFVPDLRPCYTMFSFTPSLEQVP